ncbi:hypothetical protein D3C72_1418950 [compost metagenome]
MQIAAHQGHQAATAALRIARHGASGAAGHRRNPAEQIACGVPGLYRAKAVTQAPLQGHALPRRAAAVAPLLAIEAQVHCIDGRAGVVDQRQRNPARNGTGSRRAKIGTAGGQHAQCTV